MKLSIFPEVKAVPSNKEEKQKESKKTGVIRDKKTKEVIKEYFPEVVEVIDEDDLFRILTSYAWSPSVFKGTRHEDNFMSSDFAVLDFDNGLTLDQAEQRIREANIMAFGLTSSSHTPEHHKFRVVFPLSRTVTKLEEYRATLLDLMEAFPESDPKCKDGARFFFGCRDEDGFFVDGDLLEPIKPKPEPQKQGNSSFSNRGDTSAKVLVEDDIKDIISELYGEDREKIPEAVDHFIRNAGTGLSGTWTCDLNRFAYVLSLQGIEHDVILDLVLYLAPRGELTKRDEDTIRRAVEDGIRDREEPDLVSYEGE